MSISPATPVRPLRQKSWRNLGVLVAAGILVVMAGCAGLDASGDSSATTPAPVAEKAPLWVDAWSVSYLPTLLNGQVRAVPTFSNQTIRLNLFTKLGGNQARVQFTNKFSLEPLTIGAAQLALRAEAGTVLPETDRPLTFKGATTVKLAPGTEIWSDPVNLAIPQHAEVFVSVYLPQTIQPTQFHMTGSKLSYISSPGNFVAAATMPSAGPRATTDSVFFVSGLQVKAPANTKVVVALGDSITDGATSTINTNTSWPDLLSKRLPKTGNGTSVAVINMGIGSNRLVSADAAGPSAVHRFQDDVLARPNVRYVIVLEGINDISYEHATAEQLIAAHQDLIARAHAKGLKIYGATLLPIQNSNKDTPANEATRQAVNNWLRTAKAYDAVIDFDLVMRDPANPRRLRRELTTSDFVHPNTAGYTVMAESIDLQLFE